MKLRILAAMTMLAACRPVASPPQEAPVDEDVARVLDNWHDAAAQADEARYFGYFADGAVFLGTDPGERWTLPEFRAYAHPHFAAGKAWTMHATRRVVTFENGIAWFDEDVVSEGLGNVRGSGVLVRDAAGAWKIAQYNLSVPIPNALFQDVRDLVQPPKPKPT